MREDEILTALIEDKIEQCGDYYMVTNSSFLDIRQRSLAETVCRKYKNQNYIFYGGYIEAERCIAMFLPEYIDAFNEEELNNYFKEEKESNPLTVLRITHNSYKQLSHRDYLGSLLGLGIKREMIGDILVNESGADVIVLKEISNFLLINFNKTGNINVELELISAEDINIPKARIEEKKDTVASLRLDNVIASAFNLNRTKSCEAIKSGIVFINGLQINKPDRIIKEGDKLVLRGKGKVILKSISGVTRKNRILIVIKKYI
ncbi:YlmH family RNA-binding protein [Anaerovorax odorimutans]|uniref:YlmH family RNA-binding protein n=1 Tax=Anaerovorax odorimutans TaxID=109327 RepID=UPI0003F826E9|nr:YlmH/Sll1252 family protein [Anaerovorax odorimutans]